jgi:hypothetical protein
MKINEEEAVEFTQKAYTGLMTLLNKPSPPTLNIDIKEMKEWASEFKKIESEFVESLSEKHRMVSQAFSLPLPSRDQIETEVRGSLYRSIIGGAFYDPITHTVYHTYCSTPKSLIKFLKRVGVSYSGNAVLTSKNRWKQSVQNKFYEALSGEVGHACRAVTSGYIGRHFGDEFLVLQDKNNTAYFVFVDELYEEEKPVAEPGLRLASHFNISEFFEPIGTIETAKIMRGTKFQFVPKKNYDWAKQHLDTYIENFRSSHELDEVLHTIPQVASFSLYEKGPNEFREKYIFSKDSVFYWHGQRILHELCDEFFQEFFEQLRQ